jgi:hypothetical protein
MNKNLRLNLRGEQWEKDYDNIFFQAIKKHIFIRCE